MSREEKVAMLRTWLEDGGQLRPEERAVLVEQYGEVAGVCEVAGRQGLGAGESRADGGGDETK
eukprot:1180660-Prorocentrum_lima.AAC.1